MIKSLLTSYIQYVESFVFSFALPVSLQLAVYNREYMYKQIPTKVNAKLFLLHKLFSFGFIKNFMINIDVTHKSLSLVFMWPGKSPIIFPVLSQSTCPFVPAVADLF